MEIVWLRGLAALAQVAALPPDVCIAVVARSDDSGWEALDPGDPAASRAQRLRRGLVRALVKARTGHDWEGRTLRRTPEGAPPGLRLADGSSLFFSASGGHTFVAAALAPETVGVDIEAAEPARAPAWAMLHPREKLAIEGLPEAARAHAFLRLWTAKEAWLKAGATDLFREPATFCIEISAAGGLVVFDGDRQVRPRAGGSLSGVLARAAFVAACIVRERKG